jgi:alpha-amylase/alpha-mannosidase (GH57 family)
METIYQSFYRPMLKVLYAHPSVKFVGYFSGSLLEWIEETHSEFIDVMVEMVKRRQLEIIGGGYYAPVYSLIPKPDRIGQIEQLTTYLRRNFGRRPGVVG